MRLILAITGASGIELALKFIKSLPKECELFIIKSDNSDIVIKNELKSVEIFENSDIAAKIASGSFVVESMIILPTSMNTLAKIAHGIADNLVTRVASVMIKEKRRLILVPREMPFSSIAMENMLKLSKICNITIAPPILGYYSNPSSLEEMENFLIGKWFDLLGIEHQLFKRWGEK